MHINDYMMQSLLHSSGMQQSYVLKLARIVSMSLMILLKSPTTLCCHHVVIFSNLIRYFPVIYKILTTRGQKMSNEVFKMVNQLMLVSPESLKLKFSGVPEISKENCENNMSYCINRYMMVCLPTKPKCSRIIIDSDFRHQHPGTRYKLSNLDHNIAYCCCCCLKYRYF